MEFIEIIKPGLLTTIQDLGRSNYQTYGISNGGAMDKLSLRLANILVGNDENEGAIEVTLMGPKIRFLNQGVIAITGADLSPKLNGNIVPMWKSIKVSFGDVISFGKSLYGCRSYIAVSGGIDIPIVMGSKSTFVRGGYGGLAGRRLQEGDVISTCSTEGNSDLLVGRGLSFGNIPNFKEERTLRFILGPQDDLFLKEAVDNLISSPYKILLDSDRMGYRLEGAPLIHKEGPDIITDYITAGSIQVPGSRQPIILMADCQVTGGYAKIGVVIGVDIPYLAQRKPGDQVFFEIVEIKEAQKLWKQQEQLLSLLKVNNYALSKF